MKFKSNIEIQAGLEDASGSPGTVNQLLSSTATGTAWIDPSTIAAEAATLVVIACKNTSGAAIAQGTPVYQTGTVGATATIEIAPADALISENKLPAIGLLQTDLNNNGFGNVVITGELTNFTTSPIDGVVPTTGDKIFVKSGGGLTLTKPTGEGNGIQNMGLVGKVSGGNSGSITVSSIMRANDVPNLPEGRIWVGDGNTIVSDTVYVDEPNGRMGIGTDDPVLKLHLIGTNSLPATSGTTQNGGIRIENGVNSGVLDIGASNATGAPGWIQSTDKADLSQTYNLLLNPNGGNVGIGTTSPNQKLHVIGNAKVSGVLYSSILSNDNGVSQKFRSSIGSDLMTILEGGNVGIGTTSPDSPLEIQFTEANGTAKQMLHLDYNPTNNYGSAVIKISGGSTSGASTEIEQVTGGGAGSFGTYMDTNVINRGLSSGAFGNINFVTGSSTSASSVVMTIGGGSQKGNVGIGTPSPAVKLTVNENDSGLVSSITNSSSSGSGVQITAGNGTNTSLQIRNYIGGELMRVQGNGNVGIGTTSPSAKLEVNGGGIGNTSGDIINAAIFTGGRQRVYFQNKRTADGSDWNNNTFKILAKIDSTSHQSIDFVNDASYNEHIDIYTGNQVFNTRFNSNGNVGIGTTSPGYPLEISNNAITSLVYQRTGVSANKWGFHSDNDATYWQNVTSGSLLFTLQNGGNVGIGTTSPDTKLDIEDSNPFVTIQGSSSSYVNAGVQFISNQASTARGLGNFYYSAHSDVEWFSGLPYNDNDAFVINRNTNYTVPSSLSSPPGVGASAGTLLKVDSAGAIQFNNYSGTNKTGTPTFLLGTDASGNIVKTNTIPGSAAGPYLPLAGGTMTGNTVHNDNVKSIYGTASDGLEVYHDGTNSIIADTGTGNLYIRGAASMRLQGINQSNFFIATQGGSVNLYYNNANKLDTTNTGINVTGDIRLNTKALLSNQENTNVDTGTEAIASVVLATYTAAFFDFVIKKGTNVRSGTVYACHDGTNVEFTETSTNDLGDTSDVTLNVVISTIYLQLQATTTSDDWIIKSLIRAI